MRQEPRAVALKGVRKCFGDVTAVADVDLEIRPGELMVLVGPSGCGKSTLLRLIAGLDERDAGEVWIGDRCVDEVAPGGRDVAMVFQSYALYPHMTVAENLGFGLRVRGAGTAAEIEGRVSEVADVLGLRGLLSRRPGQLSGGQQQRVALGRAMVRDPGVFLFDEPLSNLDAALRLQTRDEIAALHRRLGTTMIFVTHDQVEALSLGQRVAVMDHGRVQQVGTPHEVYRRPANLFVAGFVGSPPMNRLHLVRDREGRLVGGPFVFPGPSPLREATLGVRPEDLSVAVVTPSGSGAPPGSAGTPRGPDPNPDLTATALRVESLG
ncbi:MAG: ABC transporter ATP-binding protein, partial [Acidobacteria bacterium]|nr:ABC transporter ATP-binding protein [Acidobacteriota bacterium]